MDCVFHGMAIRIRNAIFTHRFAFTHQKTSQTRHDRGMISEPPPPTRCVIVAPGFIQNASIHYLFSRKMANKQLWFPVQINKSQKVRGSRNALRERRLLIGISGSLLSSSQNDDEWWVVGFPVSTSSLSPFDGRLPAIDALSTTRVFYSPTQYLRQVRPAAFIYPLWPPCQKLAYLFVGLCCG